MIDDSLAGATAHSSHPNKFGKDEKKLSVQIRGRDRRGSGTSSRGSALHALRIEVMRADMRLEASTRDVRRGRAGHIVTLILERDPSISSGIAGAYAEYSRAELIALLTRRVAMVGTKRWSVARP